jgi:predicted transcriptional regulator of viral defense system
MANQHILTAIKNLARPVFTTREVAGLCNGSLSNANQALNLLADKGVLFKISRGLWGLSLNKEQVSQYSIIPFLPSRQRFYVSFTSALHLYGIVEQVPQSVTLASLAHTKIIHTELGTFFVHRLAPSFFKGFGWYKGDKDFLIAEPEKALVDCFYLAARRKKQFAYFPEMSFPKNFNFKKVKQWSERIPDSRLRVNVQKRIKEFLKNLHQKLKK